MSKNRITEIGEIDSISGNSISVKLFDNIKSNIEIEDERPNDLNILDSIEEL